VALGHKYFLQGVNYKMFPDFSALAVLGEKLTAHMMLVEKTLMQIQSDIQELKNKQEVTSNERSDSNN
jgi:hypothetical protein